VSAEGLHGQLCQISSPRARISLDQVYAGDIVKLQHFSPNAISNTAIFAAVYETYLGTMPQ
jgi:hypothetical protein